MRLASRKTSLIAAGALVVAALLPSCYPGNDLTVSEADVVVTTFNPDVDFAQLGSYALIDSVFHLVPEGQTDDISRAYDAQILQKVRDNMAALRYTVASDPSTADVIMVVAITAADYTGYYSYPCWYYCWGYPPYWGSYSFRIGTILINMARSAPEGSEVSVAWLAALNGYSDKNSNLTRIRSGIDQAFTQSKYLGAGK